MPPSPRSPRSALTSEDQRLSVIAEDGDAHVPASGRTPPVPPRSTHRPFARRWRDAPPRASSELKPPEYSTYDETKQRRDRLAELREKPAVARRGGWRRLLVVIAIIILVVVVALGVGLGVGLSRYKRQNTSSDGQTPSSAGAAGQAFPAGRFAIGAFLDEVETSCTAIPTTFRCYPYSTFNSSRSASAINFNWIVSGSFPDYQISSSDNPFAISFTNITLRLIDANTDNERYTFTTSMDKVVIPSSPITSDNSQAECYYNGTVLSAALYTRKNSTQPQMLGNSTGQTPSSSLSTTTLSWQVWPFAAEVNQTINGGQSVPACYERVNGALGTQITSALTPQPTKSRCGCFYRNVNLDRLG